MYDGIQVNCIENNTVVQSNSDAPAVQTGETSSCDEVGIVSTLTENYTQCIGNK